jgi:hypothetical protein
VEAPPTLTTSQVWVSRDRKKMFFKWFSLKELVMNSKKFRGSALSLTPSSFPSSLDMILFLYHTEICQGLREGCSICLRMNTSIFETRGSHTLIGVLPAVGPVTNSLEVRRNPLPWAASPLFHPLISFRGALPLLGHNHPHQPILLTPQWVYQRRPS